MFKFLAASIMMVAIYAQPMWFENPIIAPASCADAEHISYHIHVMVLQTNAKQVAKTMDFQRRFMDKFDLHGKQNCTFTAGDPRPSMQDICTFPVDWKPEGPFFTAQYSWFIPKKDYERTTRWTRQNRDDLDVLIHPNSGCEVNDHTVWAMWAGNPWQIDPSIMSCNHPGCVPRD